MTRALIIAGFFGLIAVASAAPLGCGLINGAFPPPGPCENDVCGCNGDNCLCEQSSSSVDSCGCTSAKQGGCSCAGNCECDVHNDGCACTSKPCKIESHAPEGCGTLTWGCFGQGCRCAANDTVTCAAAPCEVVLATNLSATQCTGNGCSCDGARRSCTCVGDACTTATP